VLEDIEPWLKELGTSSYTDYIRKVAASISASERAAR